MLERFLLLFRAFLTLGVVPDDDGGEPADGADTGDDTLDDLIETVEPTKAADDAGDDEDPAKKTAAELATIKRELETERAARVAAENRRSEPAPAAKRDAEFDAEEAALAEARKEGKDLSWLQWQIDTNRKLRATLSDARAARTEAQDLNDRTQFERLELSKPKTYKRYAPKIEQAISEFKRNGQTVPPRMIMLAVMLGNEVLHGDVAHKSKRVAPAADEPKQKGVDRGRTPGVRSDVSARSKQNERDARRARLENQPL